MSKRPGTPGLLREINDRAALDLLLSAGPLSRAELGELTGLSKVTASGLLARLEQRGLVGIVGERPGSRGPNAALYGVVPSCAYAAGLDVSAERVIASVADVTGEMLSRVIVDPNGADDPVGMVHNAVVKAARTAKVGVGKIRAFVIGTPGLVDPRSGDVRFAFNLPGWHEGVLSMLRQDLKAPVTIENDVNLAGIAEHHHAANKKTDDFALLWLGGGTGLAVILRGDLHRGLSGGAGEIGYLPVPGAPLPRDTTQPKSDTYHALTGGFHLLAGGEVVKQLGADHGFGGATPAECVEAAVNAGPLGAAFLDELANRVATGVASVCAILDPGLVVLSGEVGRAGGDALAGRIEKIVAALTPNRAVVRPTAVGDDPILRGAVMLAVGQAREAAFTS